MKIVPFDESNWKKDHPTGAIAFQHMLKGDPESRENFMYILGRQDADFAMPRHRHNFEQIRLPIVGPMNIGRGQVLEVGQVGYFPEGLSYGPQDDPLGKAAPGERLSLVLQFGGSSGYGFMSIEQRRKAWDELLESGGKFVGPYYHRPDGKVQWGLNTIWEHVFGERLKYPRPRYKNVQIADIKRFNWLPVEGAQGVENKFMGSYSERGVWIEMVRIAKGATWTSTDPRARRLLVVRSGEGTAEGQDVSELTAIQADPGETLRMTATEQLEIFLIGLPPVVIPQAESDEYDLEEIPGHTLPDTLPEQPVPQRA
ncbi:hypothetical protein ACFXAZ_05145 [Streptomyces sp. NPDC059477]|uniref:hypothetical protein n=1 Tax=Streptomyces sp. NPDC059477 TaxID=3346847 RepID=UPI00368F42A8